MKDKRRGFGSMDPAKQREIASRGGKAAHAQGRAHQFTREEARVAGTKGGISVSRDAKHMQEIGRRGGQAVSSIPGHMSEIGRKGGAKVSEDPSHMAAIGRVGGQVTGSRPERT